MPITIADYIFQSHALAEEALTHPSAAADKNGGSAHYQRLEFLGDAVLGLVVAEMLFSLFPDETEGELARRQAALVCGETLVPIAKEMELGALLRLSRSEEANSGRENASNLEDAAEAVIGAVYLDGGLEPARNLIRRYWLPYAKQAKEAPKDPKTALQEWAQARSLPLPEYRVLSEDGPAHAPEFLIEVEVQGQPQAQASGPSKKLAEREAARLLLEKLPS